MVDRTRLDALLEDLAQPTGSDERILGLRLVRPAVMELLDDVTMSTLLGWQARGLDTARERMRENEWDKARDRFYDLLVNRPHQNISGANRECIRYAYKVLKAATGTES